MNKEDKQVIDMANSSGIRLDMIAMERKEQRRREADMRKQIRRKKRKLMREALLRLIPALVCILVALVLLAVIMAGHLSPADAARAAAIAVVIAFGGGLKLATVERR